MTNKYYSHIDNIKTVDMFMSLKGTFFADVSIEKPYTYYCIGTEDTREDGRLKITDNIIESIHKVFTNCSNGYNYDGQLELRLSITLNDGSKLTIDKGQAYITKQIIDILEQAHMEFMFLGQFLKYL